MLEGVERTYTGDLSDGGVVDISDKSIARCLEKIEQDFGYISTELIVEVAGAPDHPLHSKFEWDDSAAAQKYRLQQAALMIRSSRFVKRLIEGTGDRVVVRRWVSIPTNEHSYMERTRALRTTDVRASFVSRQIRILQAWLRETADISELERLRQSIERALQKYATN